MCYVRELKKKGMNDFPLSALLISAHHQLFLPSITLQALNLHEKKQTTTQSLDSRSHFLPVISVRRVGVDALDRPFSASERREVATIMH